MIFVLGCAVIMAAVTWVCGWWGIAVVALAVGVMFRASGGNAWRAALAASVAWAALLAVDAAAGPFAHVATTLGGAMSIPAGTLLMVTLLFPALLAWSAAQFGADATYLLLRR